jgi:hypothetical protein
MLIIKISVGITSVLSQTVLMQNPSTIMRRRRRRNPPATTIANNRIIKQNERIKCHFSSGRVAPLHEDSLYQSK